MKYRTVLLASVLVVSACSGDDDAQDTTPTSTSQAVVDTTSTTNPVTTPVPTTLTIAPTTDGTTTTAEPTTTAAGTTVPPSTTIATDVDWRAVVETLGQRRQDLYTNPDVGRIGEVCGGATPCFDQLDVQLSDLADKNWRVIDADPYVVLDATVEAFDGESLETSLLVTVIVVVERPADAGRIVDSDGVTVAVVEAETPEGVNTENRTILSRSGPAEDPWRVVSQERLREVPA